MTALPLATAHGVTLPNPHTRSPRNAPAARLRDALALRCADCARELDPAEPVVVAPRRVASGRLPLRRLCAACCPVAGKLPPPAGACSECGRTLLFAGMAARRRPAVCGPSCWNARRLRLERERDLARRIARTFADPPPPLERRPRECVACGVSFIARRDARACSARCRQRARRAAARATR
jgi:hypothetical protein